ncbi:putative alcohol dehydrogenase [Xylaria bambusicola]|uniref:putative alcohol dehydrogenase n=1 Tax=Xylaria bambusicola TaxID=326684 RepID=UPI00200785D7|nr:putative alcohol dehydrogenase [Xylaria bambusicola]KAI0514647.1 putative alcohol dehydrogenase [Xylaria bambusicola]
MKQWTTLMDGIDNLKLETTPTPAELKENEVLVRINCVSLNNRDLQLITGAFKNRYGSPANAIVPCSDASGTIVRIGGSTAGLLWKEGDRVFSLARSNHLTGPMHPEHAAAGIGIPLPGVLAQYRVFPAAGLVRTPSHMSDEEACTLTIAAITAWMALNWDQPINSPRRGEDVFICLQGTGGVSIAALQQAHALGLTTIVTSSSNSKLEKARALGANYVINYKTNPNWDNEVLRLTNGRGADVIVETGGPGTMNKSLCCVAHGGTVSAVGILTGLMEEGGENQIAVGMRLIQRNASLKGINIGPRDRVEEMMRLVYEENSVRPIVDRIFGFADVKAALEHLQMGSHLGKVVIRVGDD